MKKSMLLFLATVIASSTLLPTSARSGASTKSSALAVYDRWRNEVLAPLPSGINTPHFSLASSTVRTDTNTARIQFIVAGQISDFALQIKPVNVERTTDGQLKRETAGRVSEVHRSDGVLIESPSPIPMVELIMNIPIDEMTNAIEVKEVPEGKLKIFKTLLLPLGNTSFANVVGRIVRTPESNARLFKRVGLVASFQDPFPPPCPPNCDPPGQGRCVNITVCNDTCGCFGQCCLEGAADIDTTNCTVTCQLRRCTPRECLNQ
jgi:hypothetical protein